MAAIRCLCTVASLVVSACGSTGAASPFVALDAGQPMPDAAVGDAAGNDKSTGPDGTVSDEPCLDDSQCDDGIACTFKQCDTMLGRCRFTPDDARCKDGIYCNGMERCNPSVGCQPGAARDCSDDNSCTIDACVEATQSCTHTLRDADGEAHVNVRSTGPSSRLDEAS